MVYLLCSCRLFRRNLAVSFSSPTPLDFCNMGRFALDDGHLLFSLKKPGEAGVGPLRPARPRRRKPMLPFALVLARATPARQIDG